MRIALDTNRYTDLCRGDEEVVDIVEHAHSVYLPFVVVAELRAGFQVGSRGVENEHLLRRFLAKSAVVVLFADEQTTHHYARTFRQLRRQGTPVPPNDLWIAALVDQHDLVLCTRDKHFDHLPQIEQI